jgi:pimeloyl-ACP methyl ester carboxylesterase
VVTILALHGFTRGPQHLNALADACTLRGWSCVRPQVAPRWFSVRMNSRRHLDDLAAELARVCAGQQVVIAGHSAGAASGSWIGMRLLEAGIDLHGLVYIDGNDSPNHLIEMSWPSLETVAIRGVLAPPSPCNRQGRLAAFLDEHRPGSYVVIPASGHGDIEMHDSAVYRRACGDDSSPETKAAVLAAVVDAIAELAGSTS